MLQINQPYAQFTDLDGSPLDSGYLYIGTAAQNPITNPIVVYWDEAGTITASQPLRTIGGYISRNGSPARCYITQSDYSLIVQNINQVTTYSELSAASITDSLRNDLAQSSGASLVGFIQTGTGAVSRTVEDKFYDVVSFLDFMTTDEKAAVRTGTYGGVTSVHVAMQAAIDAVAAKAFNGAVYMPCGEYRITTSLNIPYGVSIYGDGGTASVLSCLSCNGLVFNSATYDGGLMFYEDFGIVGQTGSTAGFTAVTSLLPSGGVHSVDSRDGLNFSRLRIIDWNIGFNITDTWESIINNCKMSKVNTGIAIGTYSLVIRIIDNFITYEGGDTPGGTAPKHTITIDGTGAEGIEIIGNQLYGFEKNIVIGSAIFIDVLRNDMESSITCIEYGTVNNVFNIKDNYLQIDGAAGVAAIYGTGLGVEIQSQVNIEGNNFIASGTVTSYGLQLNGPANTNQYHARVCGNIFSGFATHDIYLPNPGELNIENNRCLSSAPTYSIWFGGVLAAPVIFDKNEFLKDVYIDVPANITNGLLVRGRNTVAGVKDWYGTWTPALNGFTNGGAGTITPTGTWRRDGNTAFITVNIAQAGGHTVASVANTSYISGIPAIVTPGVGSLISAANLTSKASYGVASAAIASTDIYTPVWAATAANDTVVLSGTVAL
jgi:hypothetical protein